MFYYEINWKGNSKEKKEKKIEFVTLTTFFITPSYQ